MAWVFVTGLLDAFVRFKPMIIMNRNTSPVKPLDDAQIAQVVQETDYHQYPDKERNRFVEIYAERFGFDPAELEVANGSDEWIQKLVVALGQDGVMCLEPDFVMYTSYTKQFLPEIHKVPCDGSFNFDFAKIIEAINTQKPSLFFISNPQNPTGTQFETKDLQALADAMAAVGGYLALDECYIDFAEDYERPVGENIVILRTLSKVYGMAGLRIGIAVAKGETYRKITAINHPYPVNSLALNLASALFEDEEGLAKFKDYQYKSKEKLVESLALVEDLIHVKPSAANYVFTYGERAVLLAKYLIEKGYLPRTYEDEPALKTAARYSIIRLDEYDGLQKAILEWRAQYDS